MNSSESSPWSPPPLGAVLAGGRSRRLGRDKARERIGGRTLLERSVSALGGVLDEIVVVGGASGPDSLLDVETVSDLLPGRGPLGGIHAALVRADGRAVFVLACDLPFVGPDLVRFLLGREIAPEKADETVVVPRWEGRLQPLCGVYGPGCLSRVEERLAGDRLAVHGLLDDLETLAVPIGPGISCYRPELLLNVNRVEDLEAAIELDSGRPETRHG